MCVFVLWEARQGKARDGALGQVDFVFWLDNSVFYQVQFKYETGCLRGVECGGGRGGAGRARSIRLWKAVPFHPVFSLFFMQVSRVLTCCTFMAIHQKLTLAPILG